ncbi:isoprenyl transferase [Candidatus Paracaedibacter symbiosus]|uniref:isoprenyl transferase n=1 Tax=Candidatus Paracaedibacter symbiosus TaxID=244582 RepID=UPI00068C2CED|nr:isoprenyl transferase [Candidatus Paracaedibacter symbiosus]
MIEDQAKNQIPKEIPHHIAIVMDGNGRWALRRGLPTIAGHKAGAEALKKICQAAANLGVTHLTVYAFSTENWRRPSSWIVELMDLLKYYLKFELKDLIKNNIRLHVIGDQTRLSGDLRQLVDDAVEKTKKNDGINLIIALSYGGRNEIVHAAKAIAEKVKEDKLTFDNIDEEMFAKHLYTSKFPDPDLLIRTSGEMRISNFLLWQLAYAELYFTNKLWPEFSEDDLKAAIEEYQNRERRYGTTVGS